VILYPYKISEAGVRPAFDLAEWKSQQNGPIAASIRSLPDALDFEITLDDQERNYKRSGMTAAVLEKLLLHRIGLGIVQFPRVASYLIKHYQALAGRVIDKRTLRQWNKRWYEYHRPRKAHQILTKPKLISPRLTHDLRFALDTKGIVPQDSCVALVQTEEKRFAWNRFRQQVASALARELSTADALKIILAFLNSDSSNQLLRRGRKPTPKGSYAVTDDLLAEVLVPPLKHRKHIEDLLSAVDTLRRSDDTNHSAARAKIDEIVAAELRS
jgi:hypothetical protein